MNGERVTKVHLTNDTMAITWTPRNRATGKPLQKTPAQRQIESHYPELASGLHLPKMARVVAHSEPVKAVTLPIPSGHVTPWTCSCLTQTEIRTIRRLFIQRCRCRYQWPGMIQVCFSSRQKGRWLRSHSQEADRINLLSGRRYRMAPVCRTLNPVSNCSSSGRSIPEGDSGG